MREQHGLCLLQMRVARHHNRGMGISQRDERCPELADAACELERHPPCVEARIGRDLVVARAGGMEPLAGVTDPTREFGLDRHMHVLVGDVEDERVGLDVPEDAEQP